MIIPGNGVNHRNEWFLFNMPYHFKKMRCDRFKHVYLALNWKGRPAGMVDGNINPNDYLHQAAVFDRDPHTFEGVWTDAVGLYLYDARPETWIDYPERLGLLLSQRMRTFSEIR